MKRWFVVFIALMMICLPITGLADGDIQSFTARVTGDGSYVDVTVVTVHAVTNAVITKDGQQVGGPVSIDEGDDWSMGFNVDASDAGKTLTLQLSYTGSDGQPHSQSTTVTIPGSTATPAPTPSPTPVETASATVQVSASGTNVKQGDNVKLTYVVSNTGSKTLGYVEISEPSLGKINSAENLKPGERLTFTYTLKNIAQSFQSKPRLTFVADGKTQSVTGNTVDIKVATAKLTATLEVSKTQIDAGETITLTGTVANKGDVAFKTVTISEKMLGELGTASNLASGASKTVTKQVAPQDSAVYQLVVTATDASGQKYTYSSKSVTVRVADKVVPITIDLTAQTDTVQLSEPGMVSFSIDVDNISNRPLSNVRITDQNDNTVQEIADLPIGSRNIQYECMVNTTTEFVFTATVKVDGVTSNFKSAPVTVIIAGEESVPPEEEETTTPTEMTTVSETTPAAVPVGGSNTLAKVLIGLVVVIAIIITALIALVIYGNSIRPDGRRDNNYRGSSRTKRRSANSAHRGNTRRR